MATCRPLLSVTWLCWLVAFRLETPRRSIVAFRFQRAVDGSRDGVVLLTCWFACNWLWLAAGHVTLNLSLAIGSLLWMNGMSPEGGWNGRHLFGFWLRLDPVERRTASDDKTDAAPNRGPNCHRPSICDGWIVPESWNLRTGRTRSDAINLKLNEFIENYLICLILSFKKSPTPSPTFKIV